MLKESVSPHDKYQFEIKQFLSLPPDVTSKKYSTETYLFIPASLNINQNTLNRKEFFRRLKNYIRFRIPWIPLKKIAAPKGPLAVLENCAQDTTFSWTRPEASSSIFENRIKILCLTCKRAMRSTALRTHSSPPGQVAAVSREYLIHCRHILQCYRHLSRRPSKADLPTSPAFALGDEYLSIVTATYAFQLIARLEFFPYDQQCVAQKEALLEFIRKEIHYRQNTLQTVVPEINSDNEVFVFRWSMLKKYMSSALFLDIKESRDNLFWQQVTYGMAAALAMIFATAVAFIWQDHYGSLSMPLFTALVIGYVFKDRMKDYLKDRMASGIRRFLSDRKRTIYFNFTSPIGSCKETFSFVRESSLPPAVRTLRDSIHMVDVSNAFSKETIIRYRKEIRIDKKARNMAGIGLQGGIVDITRMGVHEFLRYMDNPKEPLYALAGNGYQHVTGNKVYHVNMIRRQETAEGTSCRRYRIVLDQKGIKRIEQVRANSFPQHKEQADGQAKHTP